MVPDRDGLSKRGAVGECRWLLAMGGGLVRFGIQRVCEVLGLVVDVEVDGDAGGEKCCADGCGVVFGQVFVAALWPVPANGG